MSSTYQTTRGKLETYFDGTANEAWKRLMSDAPVSRIRETVRAGRTAMRKALLARLPEDLTGCRVLDAGCGAGQLSHELAANGAEVVGVDISPNLLDMATKTTPEALQSQITYCTGDMLDPSFGSFDYIVAMDSLIHYRPVDAAEALSKLAVRARQAIVFTVAPDTPALRAMHIAGKLFPHGDRSPAIVPTSQKQLAKHLHETLSLREGTRVKSGFYISQSMEVRKQ